MAKYTVTCSTCEENFTVQLFGKVKDREWKLDNFTWVCDDCKQKAFDEKRKQELEEAKANSQELGLPELIGSEKQIAWAEKIRVDALAIFDEEASKHKLTHEFPEIYSNYITSKVESKYWIDNRYSFVEFKFILNELVALKKQIQQNKIENSTEVIDAKIEATIRPTNTITETIAEITCQDKTIKISFPEKIEDFRLLMRANEFSWSNGQWVRVLRGVNGKLEDRATEIAIKILALGVSIRCYDEQVRTKIKNNDYEEECKKWIYTNDKADKFVISLYYDGYYEKAKKISGAKYQNKFMVVGAENYDEVLDFAEVHNYKLTSSAKELVSKMQDAKSKMFVVEPKVKDSKLNDNDYNGLSTTTGIDDDLKDD